MLESVDWKKIISEAITRDIPAVNRINAPQVNRKLVVILKGAADDEKRKCPPNNYIFVSMYDSVKPISGLKWINTWIKVDQSCFLFVPLPCKHHMLGSFFLV